ncbi:tetratricopeptide repeat protein [Companilactobacillus halodurans]|uniref:Tetratricopeptide repeat protein n=1 Tax=Companilactobacillus halodurans TaxID=2584183 RepID=A0A5P0ZWK6_9LACO|nr:tetratricopeptide repeat protein [Companilactobacillus halodurans]MQS74931.1 tetratricopeptide repeat protein [Companilactobacillus halodurans]MQS97198.1 tetratricopeptide repeat protein [Companilactobacillus halodurans]
MNKQAEQLFKQGEKEKAVHLLVSDLNKNPKQLPEILQLSTYLVQSGDLEQAEELLARSLEMFKDNQDLLYNLGNVYYLADKYDKANQIFQKLVDDNYAFEAYFMMAKTLDQQGKRQLAIMYALTATEKAPKDLPANELLADLLLANGNFEESKRFYQQANKIKPQAKHYFNMALCAMNLKEDYQDYLNQAKDLDKDYYLKNEKKLADLQEFIKQQGDSDDGK